MRLISFLLRLCVSPNPYNGSVLQTIDARNQPQGIKFLEKIYPVHGSFVGGIFYKIITGIGAIVLTGLSISGFISWRLKSGLYKS
jgi:uncharacterized iron-regulated membrane protein|tara:strand:+ start:237 stop:491 length:255 start_codon:yes stop_codon:yes gene_type:complete